MIDAEEPELGVYEWALINAGPRLAVRAALAKLLRVGALERTATGIGPARGEAPSDPFEAEVYAAAADNPRRATLMLRASRGPWMRAAVRRLIRDGYLVSRRTRRTALTRTVIPAAVLFGAGAVATATGDSVTGLLLIIIGVIACIAVFRSGMGSVRATRSGTQALGRRRSIEDLEAGDPDADPSLRVALFGMRGLERSDPTLAAEVGIPFNESASLAP